MKIRTLAVHAGEHPERYHGAASVPIYETATFVAESTEALMAVNRGERHGFVYTRLRNPTIMAAEERLAKLEGAGSAVVFASGMAAIAAAIGATLVAGDELVAATDIYGGTYRLLTEILPRQGIAVRWCDALDAAAIARSLSPKTRAVYIETPTNPLVRVADIRAIADVAHAHEARLIVDGTLGSPFNQRPLELGADLVVHSASKYLNGHSDLIVGVVAGGRDLVRNVRTHQFVTGAIVTPMAAWLLHRGLATFALRVEQHNRNGLAVSEYLAGHPKVARVHYPGLASHPDHALAQRQMRGFGGLLSFEVRGDGAAAQRVVDASRLCGIGPSIGGIESLISQPSATSHYSVPPEVRHRMGITDNLVRLSVGIEDADDLIADLAQALEAI